MSKWDNIIKPTIVNMLEKKSNFVQRFIAAVLFTPVIIFALVWSSWTYFLFFFYVVMLSMLEFYKLIKRIQITPMRILGFFLKSDYFAK
ncbi:MAG: hypothetical protein K2X94_00645 [Amoebophilaceae bacterium]|nr:hypothetical protein [Amoebophilaceae bacterium]